MERPTAGEDPGRVAETTLRGLTRRSSFVPKALRDSTKVLFTHSLVSPQVGVVGRARCSRNDRRPRLRPCRAGACGRPSDAYTAPRALPASSRLRWTATEFSRHVG